MARTAPVEASRVVGDGLTAAYMNSNVRDAVNFLATPPIARMRASGTQSIGNTTWTAINFDITDFDTDSGHSNVTNNSRYTAQVKGYYRITGTVAYAVNFVPIASYAINGSRAAAGSRVGGGTNLSTTSTADIEDIIHLSVNDYVELMTIQNSGVAAATAFSGDFGCSFSVQWLYSG
jgi:hypothetical protein